MLLTLIIVEKPLLPIPHGLQETWQCILDWNSISFLRCVLILLRKK